MLKIRSNLRIVATVVACLAVTAWSAPADDGGTKTATPTEPVSYFSMTADGVKYALFIEKKPTQTNSSCMPQVGDNYRLVVLQTNDAVEEYEGDVTEHNNENPTEITLEFLGLKFTASVDETQGMTRMKGQVPSHPGENTDFSLVMEKHHEIWYQFKNDLPYDYTCYVDPAYWGIYEFVSKSNNKNKSRFVIKGNMVQHYISLNDQTTFRHAGFDFKKL